MSFRACCNHCFKPATIKRKLYPCLICRSYAYCAQCGEHTHLHADIGHIEDYKWFRRIVDPDPFVQQIILAAIRSFTSLRIKREGDVIVITNNVEVRGVIEFGHLFLRVGNLGKDIKDIFPKEYVKFDTTSKQITYK